jgi:DNA-binding CsgD family transcriptional regulator
VSPGAVIGRDAEVDFVQAFLDEVSDGPAGLVLSGDPGIGKTILWRLGVEAARRRFGRVLSCRAVEAETALSFAGLSGLLGESVVEAADSLLAPRRKALEVALLLAEPAGPPPDTLAIALAVHDLLVGLARNGPVVIALDDAQWLDSPSAGILEVALNRLRDEPVGLLLTVRSTKGAPVPLGLERTLPEDRLTSLRVGPLSLGALHRLLKERLGLELTRHELARLQEVSGGNPYFALELGRELMRTQSRPAVGRGMRVPQSLRELLGHRLGQLPADTADVLLEVAALARPTVELVAAAHGNLEHVQDALAVAADDEIVELDDTHVAFVHPLLGSICYERAPVWKRRAVHRALAAVVTDVEERARHLALAAEGADAAVAGELDRAAEQAAARGATASAAELSELAVEMTVDDPGLARQRRLRTARFHRLAGDPERAQAMLEEVLGQVPAGAERADVLFELAATRLGNAPAQIALYQQALADVEHDDARSAWLLAFWAWARLLESDNLRALADARSALEKAERVGDPRLVATVIARLGQIEMWAGEVTPGLLERGAELEVHQELALDHMTSPRFWLARLRIRQGRLDEARAMLGELDAEAAARGNEWTHVTIRWYRSVIEWYAGHLRLALELAQDALEQGEQAQFPDNLGWGGRFKGLIETDLGLVDQARVSVSEGLAEAEARRSELFRVLCVGVLGRLELALGDLQAAGQYLSDLPGLLLSSGLNDPTQPIWADAIETLIGLGELEQARIYLEAYEESSQRSTSAWVAACVSRCRGLLSAAEGDSEAAVASLETAVTQLRETPFALERARTLLCLGTLRRQALQKKGARSALEQALAIFDRLGARLWAVKARAELARVSGRRGAGDDLTETERRVAAMAAEGASNRQIAAELFMGVSTVEAHLSHVYRKLGIRSRAGLGVRLAPAADAETKLVDAEAGT